MLMHRRPVDARAAAAFVAPMFLMFFLGMLFFVLLQWLYFAGLESSARQATVGKSMMSLRVTNLEGTAPFLRPRHRALLCENCHAE